MLEGYLQNQFLTVYLVKKTSNEKNCTDFTKSQKLNPKLSLIFIVLSSDTEIGLTIVT